jgi:lysophospholipase L1-like esterase
MSSDHSITIGASPSRPMPRNRARVAGLVLSWVIVSLVPVTRGAEPPLEGVRRVVFLGDSITYAGQYIDDVETILRVRNPTLQCEFLDLGLPSETVSGLTEPGHAGGKFPRPDLHERLDRVLNMTKPGLVVVCYGMNDGIYYPFSDERFQRFQEGIQFVRSRAEAIGAKVLHLTPPVFDSVPIKERTLPAGLAEYRQPYQGYNEVLDRYSEWLLSKKDQGWDVVDLHGPLKRYLANERKNNPEFRLADDGVHMNPTGHWIVAREILAHWGVPAGVLAAKSAEDAIAALPHGAEVFKLVQKRQGVVKDAWLTATRHTRPGMKQGVSLEESERQAAAIDAQLGALLTPRP